MQRYIKELKPTTIDEVAVMVSIYRPGPMQFVAPYIARKWGREKVSYPHPLTENALKPTYGLPIYQEQVMQIAKDMAGFTGGEADKLRKAMGKKIAKLMAEMKKKFISGAQKKGVTEREATDVFSQLEDFAAYGFNKSHGVCYAVIAYQTAYLKANFPESFMAALLTSDLDDIERIAIEIGECDRMGIKVLPPDVNESFVDFGVVKDTGNIRFGLAAIKNIGEVPSRVIYRERKARGPYKSFEDFIDRLTKTDVEGAPQEQGRTILNKKVLEALAKSGAFDSMIERNRVLEGMEIIVKRVQDTTKQIKSSQIGLFGEVLSGDIEVGKLDLPEVPAATQSQRLSWEKELLGIYLTDHPLKEIGEQLKKVTSCGLGELGLSMENKRLHLGGLITSVKKITTRSGAPMAFVSLEDATGKAEALIFPKLLENTGDLWQSDKVVLIKGKISTKDNEIKVIADSAEELDFKNKKYSAAVKVRSDKPAEGDVVVTVDTEADEIVEIDLSDETEVETLEQICKKNRAQGTVFFQANEEAIVVLHEKTPKDVLLSLKEVFEANQGKLRVVLAFAQNGDIKFVKTKTRIAFSKKIEAEVLNIIG